MHEQYICIGVPYFVGEEIDGRAEVEHIRNSGIASELNAPWITIEPDFNAVDDPLVAVNIALAQVIKAHPDRIPMIFASDCTSCLGTMKGLEDKKPAILWYDAHGDFNTHETSPSGFLGGMPLAMLVGRGDMTYMDGVDLQPTSEEQVIITDARDLDPEEDRMLHSSKVTHLTDVNDLLDTRLPDQPLYIHFDTDVINIAEMPGMNYPSPGGPSLEETSATLQRVVADAQVAGILFGLWDDRHTTEGQSLAAVLQLVRDFAWSHRQQN